MMVRDEKELKYKLALSQYGDLEIAKQIVSGNNIIRTLLRDMDDKMNICTAADVMSSHKI